MPTILVVFLAIMWFGYSEAGSLVVVMAAVTAFVAVNMFEDTEAIDKSLLDRAVTFKARSYLLVRKVFSAAADAIYLFLPFAMRSA